MNKKVSLGIAVSAAAMAAAVTFIVTLFFSLQHFNTQVQSVKEKAAKYDRLEILDTYVREHYYRVMDDEMEENVADGMLKGYMAGLEDPYSSYLTQEEYANQQVRDSGTTVGIGVTASLAEDGTIAIIEVSKGSPAEKSGIRIGDFIIAVDGEAVTDLGYEEAISRVRGEEGTQVALTVLQGEKKRDMTITRKSFDLETVTGTMLEGNIGYISISHFRENTAEQFSKALETLTADGAKALIFDVRNNGGGLLDALEKMLDPLLPEGVIATATYQDGTERTIIYSDAAELDLSMVVLVNGMSASASELFSASLRDFKSAVLVGEQTYGKGVMQSTVPVPDGGAITLTVAAYQTAVSECYHGEGLTPDIVVEAEESDIAGDPENDAQLAAAIAYLQEE